MTERYSEAFCAIVALAERLGVSKINTIAGCWEHQIDPQWFVAVNAHGEPTKCSTGATVSPFCAYIEFNGWPAGIITPHSGTIVAGDAANEDTFIAAVNAAAGGNSEARA